MTKHLSLHNLLAVLLTMAALFMGQNAWADGDWGDGDGSAEHPYVISDKAGYDLLVTNSKTNSYANTYFRLDHWISDVTETIGSDINYPFCGHINGNGCNVTLALETSNTLKLPAMITWAGEGCSVENLTVNGTITMTDGMNGAGFISQAKGAVTLTNCRSSVTITYTANYSTPHNGGFIGNLENGASATLSRCLFDGTFISETAQTFGGMVGGGGNITIQNSVVVTSSSTSLTSTSNNDNYAFSFPSSSTNLSNNYYVYDASQSHLNGIINRYNGNGQTQAWQLTLNEPATAERTGGITIGNGDGTVYADGFTLNVDGNMVVRKDYYTQGITFTFSFPGVTITAANYNGIAATLNPDGTASFTMPAANTTFTITDCTANYIDADGTLQSHSVSLLLSNTHTVTKEGGWYAVVGNITLKKGLTFRDEAHLILTDGARLNVNDDDSRNIQIAITATDLSVYGQTLGTGILKADCKNTQPTTNGIGHNYAYGIKATGNITFCGGNVYATAIGSKESTDSNGHLDCYGIHAGGNITLIRGHVSLSTRVTTMPFSTNNTTLYQFIAASLILDWHRPTDRIRLTIGPSGSYSTVSVAEGKTLWNGSEVLSGGISSSKFNNKTLQPCIAREIEGYEDGNDKWAFIASPVTGSIDPTTVGGLVATTATEYDLYRFNQSANKQWENYKAHTEGFVLENGKGYLCARKDTKTLAFMGDAFNMGTEPVTVTLAYDDNAEFAGWNLVGNPFTVDATPDRNYYVMNDEGTGIVATAVNGATPIAPCTGVLVQTTAAEAEANLNKVTFTKTTRESTGKGSLNITLTQTNTHSTETLDNAIVSFNEGSQLGKFYFGEQNANIYIPQGGEEYAIVSAGNVGEIPVYFKAKKNGTYTLTVSPTLNSQLSTLNYLHLIDNMMGADVDLLALRQAQGPASYTFTAKTTDYKSRFKLVFSTNDEDGPSAGSGTFAFVSNGNIIINGGPSTGSGTLQIVDVMGHVILSCEGDVINCVSTNGLTAGVYVLRLINGIEVKTQKLVIE